MQNIEDDARSFGFRKYADPATHKVTWRITCKGCDRVESHGWGPTTSPALMVRNMRQQNWLITEGKPPICDQCRLAGRATKTAPTLHLVQTPKFEAAERALFGKTPGTPAAPPPSAPAAPKAAVAPPLPNTALAQALQAAVEAKKPPEPDIVLSGEDFAALKALCGETIGRLTALQKRLDRLALGNRGEASRS
jgi:hypothetical protein